MEYGGGKPGDIVKNAPINKKKASKTTFPKGFSGILQKTFPEVFSTRCAALSHNDRLHRPGVRSSPSVKTVVTATKTVVTVMKAVLFLPPPLQVRAILISPSRSPYHLQDFSSEWNEPLSCSPHPAKRHLSIRMSHIRSAFVCRYFFRLQTTRLPADWRRS